MDHKLDSNRFNIVWELWVEFEAATHFATKCKIADNIVFRLGDEDENVFYKKFRQIINYTDNKSVPSEFRAFAVKTTIGGFHVFFMDEDSLPIDYAYDVPQDEVVETFAKMVAEYDYRTYKVLNNDDGIIFHQKP